MQWLTSSPRKSMSPVALESGSPNCADDLAPQWCSPARTQPEPRDLDRRAAVHDDLESFRLSAFRRSVVAHSELHPYDFGADRNRRIDHRPRRLGPTKNINHIDRLGHLGEARIDGLAVDRAAGRERVDRDGAITAPLQIGHHPMARPLAART